MKTTALVRTLNEERNIEMFCTAYRWAEKIIISDSGSTDNTVKLAKKFKNTEIHYFRDYIAGSNRTHQPRHVNQLLDLAGDSEWIMYGDCDLIPSEELTVELFNVVNNIEVWKIKVPILHIYKWNGFFPDMTSGKSIWAWRPNRIKIRCDESNPLEMNMRGGEDDTHTLFSNYPLLHHFAQDEEHIREKIAGYASIGKHIAHPEKRCGRLQTL
jgi:glycosyltransferase involved in cell wall biosynthesis